MAKWNVNRCKQFCATYAVYLGKLSASYSEKNIHQFTGGLYICDLPVQNGVHVFPLLGEIRGLYVIKKPFVMLSNCLLFWTLDYEELALQKLESVPLLDSSGYS